MSEAPGAENASPGSGVPVPRGSANEVLDVRHGMFGPKGTGDTSGYGRLVRTVALPGAAVRPYGGPHAADGDEGRVEGEFDVVADELEGALAEAGIAYDDVVERVVVDRGEMTLHVHRDGLVKTALTLRDDAALRFELCTGVSGVHYPTDEGREFHAVYHLRSITYNRLVRLEVAAPAADPHMPSLVKVYPTLDWHERETYDMFGIVFDGHPALTRILMPDDWPGHPQRKDYPLGGVPVEYKGAQIPPPDQRRSYS
jgi:NADH-quinone oxidoreductase subunit C